MLGIVLLVVLRAVGTSESGTVPAADLITIAEQVEARVIKLRGLALKKPIKWEVASKEQLRAYLHETLSQQYVPGEIEHEGDAYKALGLIPPALDYQSYILALYEEQVGGYYDPKKKTFFLADWIAPGMQESIIAHEFVHALDDQHFGLEKFIERIRGNSDLMLARSAFAEGGATLAMMIDMLSGQGIELDFSALDLDGIVGEAMMAISAAQYSKFSEAPRMLREALTFPYLKGMVFVVDGHQRGGWAAINRIYSDLPASTEQILHPAKYYLRRDQPATVSLGFADNLIPKEWKQIYEDVLGEFMVLQLLGNIDDRDEVKRAAEGWGGDRLRVYQNGAEFAWIELSVWDSPRDAVEFAGAFSKTVRSRVPHFILQPLVKSVPEMVWKGPDDRLVIVSRRGSKVLLLENFDESLALKIRKAALSSKE